MEGSAYRRRDILFWECQHPGRAPLFFYGALHFGNSRMYPLPVPVEDAYCRCDTLAFETDLNQVGGFEFHRRLSEQGHYSDGDSLSSHLPHGLWTELCETASQFWHSPEELDRCRSWYCASILTSEALQRTGLASGMGIDNFLHDRASRDTDKKFLYLETPEKQLELLSGMDTDDDAAFLTETLEEIRDMPGFSERLLNLWLSGDAASLARLIARNFNNEARQQERLLAERNRAWFRSILTANISGASVLSVIGAGHLVGRHNLVGMFLHEGYHLIPLKS